MGIREARDLIFSCLVQVDARLQAQQFLFELVCLLRPVCLFLLEHCSYGQTIDVGHLVCMEASVKAAEIVELLAESAQLRTNLSLIVLTTLEGLHALVELLLVLDCKLCLVQSSLILLQDATLHARKVHLS